jgi:hypothetical protein
LRSSVEIGQRLSIKREARANGLADADIDAEPDAWRDEPRA